MEVLRVYEPAECDSAGVPLDWERCRGLDELDGGMGSLHEACRQRGEDCPYCAGHGSLRAAALACAAKAEWRVARGYPFKPSPEPPDGLTPRCRGCGHPMSDGIWEDPPLAKWNGYVETRAKAAAAIMAGREIAAHVHSQHYSPCDEGCHHHPLTDCRAVRGGATHPHAEWSWQNGYSTWPREASWRPVDVRSLSWPHDLRPEKLAVLCLRCFAERKTQ
jgi:hypothetical protein